MRKRGWQVERQCQLRVSAEHRWRQLVYTSVFNLNFDLKFQLQLLLHNGEHETHGAIRQAARRAKWIVDVGAGSGELCISAAALRNLTRIIAIEPDQAMVRSLQAKIDCSEILYNSILSGRISIIEKFIGTQNGDKHVRLDQIGIDHSHRGFIRINIDGAEFEVLRSGRQLLASAKADILVKTYSDELQKHCFDFLEEAGYSCGIIKKAWWRSLIAEQRPREHNRWLFATRSL